MKGRAPPCSPPHRGVGKLVVSRAAAQAGVSVFNPDNKMRVIAPGMQALPGLRWCLVPSKPTEASVSTKTPHSSKEGDAVLKRVLKLVTPVP